ncbi:MAG: hypothetical protein NTV45_05205 [Firmicutes bacterium]|nr:hypothetical protein [Bacillota bacterium]
MIKIISYVSRLLSVVLIIFFAFFLTARTSPVLGDQALIRELFTVIIVGITIAAWRIPMMGGLIFILFGIRYFVMIARPGDLNPALILLALFAVTGILFMVEGYYTNKGNKPIPQKLWFT